MKSSKNTKYEIFFILPSDSGERTWVLIEILMDRVDCMVAARYWLIMYDFVVVHFFQEDVVLREDTVVRPMKAAHKLKSTIPNKEVLI